jgi:hypothetical protein
MLRRAAPARNDGLIVVLLLLVLLLVLRVVAQTKPAA